MGYKRIGEELSFADLAVSKTLVHNRSVKLMDKINKVVSWRNIEVLLMEYYDTDRSKEGADAYPPILLLKCMLLQKWFRIPSDPELENQINDRISFKKFLGLPLDKPSPDHSTFSRFRNRLSKEAMIKLNDVVL
ncbi:transposase [Thermodesulfobacteriota bacterium]